MLSRCSRQLMINPRGANSLSAPRAQAFSTTSVARTKYRGTRNPRNNEIKLPLVQLVDPETNKLRDPEPPEKILAPIELKTHYLELVSEDPPVVKIIDKKEVLAAKKAEKARNRVSKMEHKEVQMTWNVTEADLMHKLNKVKNYLERGDIVDVAFAPKAKQHTPPLPELKARMQLVVDTMKDIGVERQPWTLERGVGIVFLRREGKSKNRPKTETEVS